MHVIRHGNFNELSRGRRQKILSSEIDRSFDEFFLANSDKSISRTLSRTIGAHPSTSSYLLTNRASNLDLDAKTPVSASEAHLIPLFIFGTVRSCIYIHPSSGGVVAAANKFISIRRSLGAVPRGGERGGGGGEESRRDGNSQLSGNGTFYVPRGRINLNSHYCREARRDTPYDPTPNKGNSGLLGRTALGFRFISFGTEAAGVSIRPPPGS